MKWTVHGERTIYDSPWVRLALTDVEIPGGARFDHHVVRMPAAASGTVVHDPARGVLLLWRHRFTTDTWGWEVPAGRIDDGETPEQAAARETLEETGWATACRSRPCSGGSRSRPGERTLGTPLTWRAAVLKVSSSRADEDGRRSREARQRAGDDRKGTTTP
jgi:ADP-ribose pyrophosphatase YjhB (NUDIX family)